MEEYPITGIRSTFAPYEDTDAWRKVAEPFLKELKIGQLVVLMAEPDNIEDKEAIAAYIDYRHIGYISREVTSKVHQFLDENAQCKSFVIRTDLHATIWVTIPGEPHRPANPRQRVLPERPLAEGVRMGFTSAERTHGVAAGQLIGLEANKANMAEIMGAAEVYAGLLGLSICREETEWMARIERKLFGILDRSRELGLTDEQAAALSHIYNNVKEASGDQHCSGDCSPERIFASHLDRLRADRQANGNLFDRFCKVYLDGKPFDQADKARIMAEHERLSCWLKSLPWPELQNAADLQQMGRKVKYLRLSREEIYDLYSVLLLIEKLESCCQMSASDNILMSEQAIVYWERLKKKGFVDSECRLLSTTTRQQAMYIADLFAEKLNLTSKWKPFEQFWNIKNLAQEKYHFQEIGKSPARAKEIDAIFSD